MGYDRQGMNQTKLYGYHLLARLDWRKNHGLTHTIILVTYVTIVTIYIKGSYNTIAPHFEQPFHVFLPQ